MLKYTKCKVCGSDAERDALNGFYVRCSNPECILHDNYYNIKRWNEQPPTAAKGDRVN